MPPELAQWIPPAVIVGVMLYLHRTTRQDVAQLRQDMKQLEVRLESRFESGMERVESQIGELRERMAHLEGLLEGLREAITRRNVAWASPGANFPKIRRKRRPSFGLYGPISPAPRVRVRPLGVLATLERSRRLRGKVLAVPHRELSPHPARPTGFLPELGRYGTMGSTPTSPTRAEERRDSMRTMTTIILIFVFLGAAPALAQLPPEIMVDRYLLRAERLLEAKDHEGALDMMSKIRALQNEHDLTVPEEFHFKYAQVAFSAGSLQAAVDSVNKYLAAAGREGEFYREALELLDEVEQAQILPDQYLEQAEELMAKKEYGVALEALNKVVALQREYGLTVPEEFHFKYAQVASVAGSYGAAMESLKRYLAAAGRSGQFYREALELLVEAEQSVPLKPEMMEIRAGRFWMGCNRDRNRDSNREERRAGDSKRRNRPANPPPLCTNDDEQPVHEVRVGTFELSKYEVTFAEYDRFTTATGRERADDEGWGRGGRPVIKVSWEDAVAYTVWLSEATGASYRLPSEAEWEYAARAGTETMYSWGNEIGHGFRIRVRANCKGCTSWWGNEKTAPVGSFVANGWGLHDMPGNVNEWVQDCWHENYWGAPTDGSAWESGNCSLRVLRGGSWLDDPRFLRSANRYEITTGSRNNRIGFRVARTVTP